LTQKNQKVKAVNSRNDWGSCAERIQGPALMTPKPYLINYPAWLWIRNAPLHFPSPWIQGRFHLELPMGPGLSPNHVFEICLPWTLHLETTFAWICEKATVEFGGFHNGIKNMNEYRITWNVILVYNLHSFLSRTNP